MKSVSMFDFRRKFSDLVYQAASEGQPAVIMKYNKPYAILLGFEDYRERFGEEASELKLEPWHPPEELEDDRRRPSAWALTAANDLREFLLDRHPGAQVPKGEPFGWAFEIMRINASEDEIGEAILWLYSSENEGEFRIEVQSGKALREKFGKVQAAMKREKHAPSEPMPRAPIKPFVPPDIEPAASPEELVEYRKRLDSKEPETEWERERRKRRERFNGSS